MSIRTFFITSILIILGIHITYGQPMAIKEWQTDKNFVDSIMVKKSQKFKWYYSDFVLGGSLIWMVSEYYNYDHDLSKYKDNIKKYDSMKNEKELEFLKIRKKIDKIHSCLEKDQKRYLIAKKIVIGSAIASVLFRMAGGLFIHEKNKSQAVKLSPEIMQSSYNDKIWGIKIRYNF